MRSSFEWIKCGMDLEPCVVLPTIGMLKHCFVLEMSFVGHIISSF